VSDFCGWGLPLPGCQDAQAQEIEACAAVDGPLDQLKAVNVSFDRAIAPFVFESCHDCRFIPGQVSGEGSERRMTRRFAPPRPGREIALLHDAEELLSDTGCDGDLRATTIQLVQMTLATCFSVDDDMLWWGLFDTELYVEHGDRRYGPYLPDGGPIPLHRYRAFKKTAVEKQADRIEELAARLGLPRAALSGRPEIAELVSERKIAVATFADPDPFQEFQYPNAMAAKRAIADFLGMPLGKLSGEQMEQVHAIVNATLDKKRVLEQIRQYFRHPTGEHPRC
jgi:hypothetical protein